MDNFDTKCKREFRESQIKNTIDHAIKKLQNEDRFLIEHIIREESLSHRLATYLENSFAEEYDIDCEYNKKIDIENENISVNNKSVREYRRSPITNRRDIRPDIIIHKRGKNNKKSNLLVIQLKKKGNRQRRDKDIDSLIQLTDQKGDYKYQYGLFLDINTSSNVEARWFMDKEEMCHYVILTSS